MREALGVGVKLVDACSDADLSQPRVQLEAAVQECSGAGVPQGRRLWAAVKLAAASRADVS